MDGSITELVWISDHDCSDLLSVDKKRNWDKSTIHYSNWECISYLVTFLCTIMLGAFKVQSPSEYWTSPVFRWLICVLKLNGPVFKWHLNTRQTWKFTFCLGHFTRYQWWKIIQSGSDNWMPDIRKISISSHIWVRISNFGGHLCF